MKRTDVTDMFIDIRDFDDAEEAQKEVEALQEKVEEFINYVEDKFNEIRDKLSEFSFEDLDFLTDAHQIAGKLSDDLF